MERKSLCAFELRAGEGPAFVELSLRGSAVVQRIRVSQDADWNESTARFDSVAEARDHFEHMVGQYSKRGSMVRSEREGERNTLAVRPTLMLPEARAVVSDFVLEEGPALFGPSLFTLIEQGAIELELEARTLRGAVLRPTTSERTGGRVAHQVHLLTTELLGRPIARTLTSLVLAERAGGATPYESIKFVADGVTLAVRAASRSDVAPSLKVLAAGTFEEPGQGKADFRRCLKRFERLAELRLVFADGVTVPRLSTPSLQKLEVGWLGTRAEIDAVLKSPLPALEHLALGVRRDARAELAALAPLLRGAVFPRLTHLALVWQTLDVWLEGELHETIGEEVEQADAEALYAALASGSLLGRLRTLHVGHRVPAQTLLRLAPSLAHLKRVELRLEDPDDAELIRGALPNAVLLPFR